MAAAGTCINSAPRRGAHRNSGCVLPYAPLRLVSFGGCPSKQVPCRGAHRNSGCHSSRAGRPPNGLARPASIRSQNRSVSRRLPVSCVLRRNLPLARPFAGVLRPETPESGFGGK